MSAAVSVRRAWERLKRVDAGLLGAFLLLLLAVALPPITLQKRTPQLLVVFDITQSMGVTDMTLDGRAVSRLEFARHAARDVLRRLPCGSRVGWGVFTDYRALALLAPLEVCAHYEALRASLDQIDGRMRWANASQIAKGVYWSARAARELGAETHAVFLTDGQQAPPTRDDAADAPPLPDDARALIAGVGGDTPARIPRFDEDGHPSGYWQAEDVIQRPDRADSREELSRVDEANLRKLAARPGLAYMRVRASDDLAHALAGLPGPTGNVAADLRWIAALLALVLLVQRSLAAWRPMLRAGVRHALLPPRG